MNIGDMLVVTAELAVGLLGIILGQSLLIITSFVLLIISGIRACMGADVYVRVFRYVEMLFYLIAAIVYYSCCEAFFAPNMTTKYDKIMKDHQICRNISITKSPESGDNTTSPNYTLDQSAIMTSPKDFVALLINIKRLRNQIHQTAKDANISKKVTEECANDSAYTPLVYTFAQFMIVVCELLKLLPSLVSKDFSPRKECYLLWFGLHLFTSLVGFLECYVIDFYLVGADYFNSIFLAQIIYVVISPGSFLSNNAVGVHMLNVTFISVLISAATFSFVDYTAFDVIFEILFLLLFVLYTFLQLVLHSDTTEKESPAVTKIKEVYTNLGHSFLQDYDDYYFYGINIYATVWFFRLGRWLWSNTHLALPICLLVLLCLINSLLFEIIEIGRNCCKLHRARVEQEDQ